MLFRSSLILRRECFPRSLVHSSVYSLCCAALRFVNLSFNSCIRVIILFMQCNVIYNSCPEYDCSRLIREKVGLVRKTGSEFTETMKNMVLLKLKPPLSPLFCLAENVKCRRIQLLACNINKDVKRLCGEETHFSK